MSNRIRAAVFDLDGTLIDSVPDIAAAANRYLEARGLPVPDAELVETFVGWGPRKLMVDVLKTLDQPTDDAAVDAAVAGFMEVYWRHPADLTRFFPHVREDLETLKAAGFALGVCTNKPHDLTLKVLETLGVGHLFASVVGSGVAAANKPDPAHLLEVARRMDLAPGEWVYVGDTVVDRRTAEAARVRFFAVPWGGGRHLEVAEGARLSRLADLVDLG